MRAPGGTYDYESTTTRRFFKGRTEVVRVTSECDAFVHAMMAEGVEKEKLFELAAKAHGAHIANEQVAG